MGTHGLIGFITQVARHGCYNHYDPYSGDLGQDIVDCILSLDLTPEQIATMADRVQQIKWAEGAIDNGEDSSMIRAIQSGETTQAYFMDFEDQKLETWASGQLVDTITFDGLRENMDYIGKMK